MQGNETVAMDVLRRAGLSHHGVLGSGVEGTVVDLGDGTVAKVWSGRGLADLTALRAFYDAVLQRRPGGSPVAMPHVLDLWEVEGHWITVEQKLWGEPVWRPDGTSPDLTPSQVDAMTDALTALAATPGDPSFRTLPMLPDEPPFHSTAPFEQELAGLVQRRAERFAVPLRAALHDLDTVLADTVAALRGLHPASPTLIHGDLIAGNVLTSGTHATAVLDFGFLSTAGDPAFDAALAASIFDMWGPRAREVERTLDRAFVAAFGHDHRRYSIYRAAYALITACCFGTDRSDGHFAWCITMASRPDVRDALRS